MTIRILQGNCLDVLRTLPDSSVNCCVTSPPYWGLRDYGTEPVPWPAVSYEPMPGLGRVVEVPAGHASLGLEPTIAEFLGHMVAVFREVRRVLRDDGTCWVNMGDSYNAAGRVGQGAREGYKQGTNRASAAGADSFRPSVSTLKPKDLIGIPWRVAFALQADGWYLRQDIIWHKTRVMPTSSKDRCTTNHEYIFLLTKRPDYYFDGDAIRTPLAEVSKKRVAHKWKSEKVNVSAKGAVGIDLERMGSRFAPETGANIRSVWSVCPSNYKGAHFATFPPALIEPCILAGSRPGDVVLDPFGGAGTTGLVADRLQRDALLIELNPAYAGIARRRIASDAPLFAEVAS